MYFLAISYFVLGPMLGVIVYMIYRAVSAPFAQPEPIPYEDQPAGRIHLLSGDRYLDSSPFNPFEHPRLNWADGSISCLLATELAETPEYQPAMIGTVKFLKPAELHGLVSVILDAKKVAELGLEPAGLVSGARMLADRAMQWSLPG